MKENLLTISELAGLSRVTRDALLHYDSIGLLSPVARGENNYRFYSNEQISLVNQIRTFQALGMSLKEIKEISEHRSPARILEILNNQTKNIDRNIEDLHKSRELLMTLKQTIEDALEVDEKKIEIRHVRAEPIFLGPINDYSTGKTAWDSLIEFYRYCRKKGNDIELNYAAWGMFSKERILRGDWKYPDRYFSNNPNGKDVKPEGLYAIGYTRGTYGGGDKLFQRLLSYIKSQGYKVCGPAYECYPLNEITIPDINNYLIKISIQVEKI
jgi:DNA-binding transcriptional MerR regulator